MRVVRSESLGGSGNANQRYKKEFCFVAHTCRICNRFTNPGAGVRGGGVLEPFIEVLDSFPSSLRAEGEDKEL